jgi:sensor histidine kinase YesM
MKLIVNDPEYTPFGLSWMRGITPARLGLLLLITLAFAAFSHAGTFAAFGFSWRAANTSFSSLTTPWSLWMRLFVDGIPLFLLLITADLRTAGSPPRIRIRWLAAAVVAGAALAALIHLAVGVAIGMSWRRWPLPNYLPIVGYNALLIGSAFAAMLFCARSELDAARRLQQERLHRLAAERQDAEARLQVLHAQIEPHFLFNSLASVKRLYELGPEHGRALMTNLGRCLRMAVASGEQRLTTLGREVEVARGLLDVLQLRMGERLRVQIDVRPEAAGALIPSFILGTLVENAVKHGIAPRASGGTVTINGRREADQLVVEVIDDGLGFRGETGPGVGLANSRSRLASLFGPSARLDLSRNRSGGVTARVTIPYRTAGVDSGGVQPQAKGVTSAAVSAANPLPQRFLTRAWRLLTWRHIAWATALGVALIAIVRSVNLLTGGVDTWNHLLVDTLWIVLFAHLFVTAIVLVEASKPPEPSSMSARFAIGAAVAGILCMVLSWTFATEWTLARRVASPERKEVMIAIMTAKTFDVRRAAVLSFGGQAAFFGCLGTALYVWLRNARLAAAALAAGELARAEAERRAAAARLEATRSEVDPNRVFESLDQIRELYERDRASADAMLDELIAFLRAAIPRTRVEGGAAQPVV